MSLLDEKLKQALTSLIEVYRELNGNNISTYDVVNSLFTKEGLDHLFETTNKSEKIKKGKILKIIQQFLKETVQSDNVKSDEMNSNSNEDLEELKYLDSDEKIVNYKSILSSKNASFLSDQTEIPQEKIDSIQEILSTLLIELRDDEEINVQELETSSTPPNIEERKQNLSLLDPLLHCFTYFSDNSSSEMTCQIPITSVIIHFFLNHKEKFVFGANESLTKNNKVLKSTLEYCGIEVLENKPSIHGDTHIRHNTSGTKHFEDPVLLIMEHQCDSCPSPFQHKDFEKIAVCMRSAAKHYLYYLKEKGKAKSGVSATCFGILSSRDFAHFLQLKAIINTDNNASGDGWIAYSLSIISSHNLLYISSRNSMIKQIDKIFQYGVNLNYEVVKKEEAIGRFTHTPTVSFMPSKDGILSFAQLEELCITLRYEESIALLQQEGYRYTATAIINDYKDWYSIATQNTVYFLTNTPEDRLQKYETGIDFKTKVALFITVIPGITCVYIEKASKNLQPPQRSNDDSSGTKDDEDNEKKRKNLLTNWDSTTSKKQKGTENKTNYQQQGGKQMNNEFLGQLLSKYNVYISQSGYKIKRWSGEDKNLYLYYHSNYQKKNDFIFNSTFTKVTWCDKNTYKENSSVMNALKQLSDKTKVHSKTICHLYVYEVVTMKKNEIMQLFGEENNTVNEEEESKVFITVSEYLDSWKDYLTKEFTKLYNSNNVSLKLGFILNVMLGCLRGLSQIHNMSVIHCDLSFSNISVRCHRYFTYGSENEFDENELMLFKLFKKHSMQTFQAVLFDFNSSKFEDQKISPLFLNMLSEQSNSINEDISINNSEESFYFPQVTMGYYSHPIAFTKAHDIYSVSIVFGQLLDILFPFDKSYSSTTELETKIQSEIESQPLPNLVSKVAKKTKIIKNNKEKICRINFLGDVLEEICNLILDMIENPHGFSYNNTDEKDHYCKSRLSQIISLLTNTTIKK
ncbi:hypothetical protein ABK040_000387 [Willaertia magna]